MMAVGQPKAWIWINAPLMLGFPKGLLSMITGVQEELESKFQHIVDFIGSAKQSVDATLHKPLHLVGNEEELEKPKAVRLGTFNVHIGSSKFQQIVDLIRSASPISLCCHPINKHFCCIAVQRYYFCVIVRMVPFVTMTLT